MSLPGDSIFRSGMFPGLWLDAEAMFRNQRRRVVTVLNQGLATPKHAALVAKLEKQASRKRP